MKEVALTKRTNTATNYILSFFKVRKRRQLIHLIFFCDLKLTKDRQILRKSTNLLKELSNDVFFMFNMSISNKYTTYMYNFLIF